MRPSWDEYLLLLSFVTALRSTCNQAKHGCVIVENNQIISTGFNGSPSGEPHCIENGCRMIDNHCLRCRHAEVNALIQALKKRKNISGLSVYVTGTPCLDCAKSLIRENVSKVIYGRSYGDETRIKELFATANIDLKFIDSETLQKYISIDEIGIKLGGI